MRPSGSAESTMNSVTSSAAGPATTNTFQPPAAAVAFSTKPELQSASCRLHNQFIKQARCAANGARHDRTSNTLPCVVYFNAFESRLRIICSSRRGSL